MTRESGSNGAFWALRILESLLLLGMLAGIGLFAYSLVDIVRIETGNAAGTAVPPSAWPGVAVFGGSLVLLQFVRIALMRYRNADGTPRSAAVASAAAATADVLAGVDAPAGESEVVTDTETGA